MMFDLLWHLQEAAALIARIDTVMGLAESIKHRPIPRLEPNEDELPLDADLSMLPLDKQVAHLQVCCVAWVVV